MELIKDNYLRGSGNGPTWNVEIDPPKRKVKSYYEETIIAAEYLYANKTGKLHVMYSGGFDSQYVINIFKKLGFDFTPVIIRLQGNDQEQDYNYFDTKHAFEFCSSSGLTPIVVPFNYDKFVESGEFTEIGKEIKCGSIRSQATLKVAGSIDGFTVWGNDPPYMKYNVERAVWQLEELEVIHCLLNFYRNRNIAGCPYFLSYTPEMMLSFLLDPYMVDLANGKYPGKLGTNSSKTHVYNNGSGFNMPHYSFAPGGRPKVDGYELIVKSPIRAHPKLLEYDELKKNWQGEWYEDYHTIVPKLSVHQ
jgi:hypothetical protein